MKVYLVFYFDESCEGCPDELVAVCSTREKAEEFIKDAERLWGENPKNYYIVEEVVI